MYFPCVISETIEHATPMIAGSPVNNKYKETDYLLLSGDPKVIGLAIAVACDINNGKYTTLTWDRQEKMYYPIEINLYEKGNVED